MPSPADREKALETALAQIDRQFGKGSVMRLGSDERAPVAIIPTGSIALDVALGIGGLPRGRIVEIYGPESSGKTTVALHAVAEQREVHLEDGLERLLVALVLHQRRAEDGLEHVAVVDVDVLQRAHGVEVLGHRDREPRGAQLVDEALEDVEQRR